MLLCPFAFIRMMAWLFWRTSSAHKLSFFVRQNDLDILKILYILTYFFMKNKKINWFLKHWILSSFLFLIILWWIISWFEKWEEEIVYDIPEHTIIQETKLIDWDNLIEVLIPSLTNKTTKTELQDIAWNMAEKYNVQQVEIYCNLEAQKANYSSSFSEQNPWAIEECFLWEYSF